MNEKIIKSVEEYYSEKITMYGNVPQGVDWNGRDSQFLRFKQLSKVLIKKSDFSILDYGCGFGSLIEYLKEENHKRFNYSGFDVSDAMLKAAREKFKSENINFINNLDLLKNVDYTIASGIFNVKLSNKDSDWIKYIKTILNRIDSISNKGFSFNLLTTYSDEEYKKDYLFYADPTYYFEYCKKCFSKNVALLHDYNLYEFTIIVRK